MQVQAYLFFEGRCDEALEFYRGAVGAEIQEVLRYKDAPPDAQEGGDGCMPGMPADKVMHARFKVGDTILFASDGRCSNQPKFDGFSLSYTAKDEAEARRVFDKLGAGGTVIMPLGKTFFAPSFGMTTDRFGLTWMVIVNQA